MKKNQYLLRLEIIKERIHSFYTEANEESARNIRDEISDWIDDLGYEPMINWFNGADS